MQKWRCEWILIGDRSVGRLSILLLGNWQAPVFFTHIPENIKFGWKICPRESIWISIFPLQRPVAKKSSLRESIFSPDLSPSHKFRHRLQLTVTITLWWWDERETKIDSFACGLLYSFLYSSYSSLSVNGCCWSENLLLLLPLLPIRCVWKLVL